MEVIDFLSPDCIKVPLSSSDRSGAISELVDLLDHHKKLTDPEEIKTNILKREQIRSTGVGHGVAIPHGKSTLIKETILAIGKPNVPIDFKSIDGKPVGIIFLLVSHPSQTAEHIQILAKISRLCVRSDIRNDIIKSQDAQTIYQVIFAASQQTTTFRKDGDAPLLGF
jgi:fructose-specific phosphotransferase system IIA component